MNDVNYSTPNGCEKDEKPLHYEMCGLDNIFLLNGFNYHETAYGEYFSINDADKLHKTIGMFLVQEKKSLIGKEIRFLRENMKLTQAKLAKRMSVDGQTLDRWEKGETIIPVISEQCLKVGYLARFCPYYELEQVMEIMISLIEMDPWHGTHLNFKHDGVSWYNTIAG